MNEIPGYPLRWQVVPESFVSSRPRECCPVASETYPPQVKVKFSASQLGPAGIPKLAVGEDGVAPKMGSDVVVPGVIVEVVVDGARVAEERAALCGEGVVAHALSAAAPSTNIKVKGTLVPLIRPAGPHPSIDRDRRPGEASNGRFSPGGRGHPSPETSHLFEPRHVVRAVET